MKRAISIARAQSAPAELVGTNRRVLLVDDNSAIHGDMRKTLTSSDTSELEAMEAALLDGKRTWSFTPCEVSSAYQGEEGFERIRDARRAGRPYAVAFVDMRMPPGWDGVRTVDAILAIDPEVQVVICTAYSDHAWEDVLDRYASQDRLLILKKPFDVAEVRQLVNALTEKWRLTRQTEEQLTELSAKGEVLAKSLAWADSIQEAVLDGIVVFDDGGRVVSASRRFSTMWRLPEGWATTVDAATLFAHLASQLRDPEECFTRVRHLLDRPDEASREDIHLADGRTFDRWSGPVQDVVVAAMYGRIWCFRDVTEQRRLDADRAIVTERLASMGRIAAGVGHEINNPLAYVMANVEFLAEILAGDPHASPEAGAEVDGILADTRGGLERIRLIVRDLQTLARADEEKRTTVDVTRVLDASIKIATNELRHRARVVRRFAPVPRVFGNEARLGQVFLNLLINAAQAIPEGRAQDAQITIDLGVSDDGGVRVDIADTGAGISKEHLDRIFDPFFTTKAVGKGTGLGLSICQGIIQAHQGTISARTLEGVGTTFTVRLPPALQEGMPSRFPHGMIQASRRARVLVIDDDVALAASVIRLLRGSHDVSACNGGREALALLASGEEFDLILCDLMMPDLSGMDLHAEIARVSPKTLEKMVFFTGGAFTPRAEAFLAEVGNERVEKPFNRLALLGLIARKVA